MPDGRSCGGIDGGDRPRGHVDASMIGVTNSLPSHALPKFESYRCARNHLNFPTKVSVADEQFHGIGRLEQRGASATKGLGQNGLAMRWLVEQNKNHKFLAKPA